jgi:hypothetical protein
MPSYTRRCRACVLNLFGSGRNDVQRGADLVSNARRQPADGGQPIGMAELLQAAIRASDSVRATSCAATRSRHMSIQGGSQFAQFIPGLQMEFRRRSPCPMRRTRSARRVKGRPTISVPRTVIVKGTHGKQSSPSSPRIWQSFDADRSAIETSTRSVPGHPRESHRHERAHR